MVEEQLDYKKLRDDGFIKINNFLNSEETNQAREIVQFYNSSKGNKETIARMVDSMFAALDEDASGTVAMSELVGVLFPKAIGDNREDIGKYHYCIFVIPICFNRCCLYDLFLFNFDNNVLFFFPFFFFPTFFLYFSFFFFSSVVFNDGCHTQQQFGRRRRRRDWSSIGCSAYRIETIV